MGYFGHIENGTVVLDEPVKLPEGARVRIHLVDEDGKASARCEQEPSLGQKFLELFQELQNDSRVTIFPPSADQYHRGLDLYARRLDKDSSLTDCISFEVMQQSDLTEALTADYHFEQTGFNILLK